MNHRSPFSFAVSSAARRPLAYSWIAVAAALLAGCGGGGGGGSSNGGGSTPNDTSWIANEGWSGSNAITLDATPSSWVAKGVRDDPTNVVIVRARIPQDLTTIPGEVYIVVPTTAANGQTFTQTTSPGAPTTGPRVQFFDYRNLATGGGQTLYNAATQGSYSITVADVTATHVDLTFTATLYNPNDTSESHTVSGTIGVDTTSN